MDEEGPDFIVFGPRILSRIVSIRTLFSMNTNESVTA